MRRVCVRSGEDFWGSGVGRTVSRVLSERVPRPGLGEVPRTVGGRDTGGQSVCTTGTPDTEDGSVSEDEVWKGGGPLLPLGGRYLGCFGGVLGVEGPALREDVPVLRPVHHEDPPLPSPHSGPWVRGVGVGGVGAGGVGVGGSGHGGSGYRGSGPGVVPLLLRDPLEVLHGGVVPRDV